MNFYCTLFNIKYFSRGLAMCQSLLEQDKQAFIYILAIDQLTAQILNQYSLPNTQIISLSDFEDQDLLRIKLSRSLGEYCWTITPSLILYCLKKYNLAQVCYIDADLYFYQNPAVLIEEAQNNSILLSPHRYSPKYDQSKTSGIYCVQFMNFMNDSKGLEALIWWRNACIEWCFNRIEPNRFGDQKYLDDWPTRFDSVHVLEHLGGGVAPWNVQQYGFINLEPNNFKMKNNQSEIFDLIFYHFHGVKFYSNGQIDFGGYFLEASVKRKIYLPYVKKILKIDNQLIKEKWISKTNYLTQVCDQNESSFKKKIQGLIQKFNKTYNKISAKQWIKEFD
jgi:hypothetical protein